MFYLTMYSTHFIYGYMASDTVKKHSNRGNPLPSLHGLLFRVCVCGGGGWGGGGELFTCPYSLKVQTCPPWDQRPAFLFRVSVQED